MRINSRYRLLGQIGQGGEARVFRAQDLTTGEDVAVRLSCRPSFRANASVPPPAHPGWARLLDQGTTPDHGPFQVFELLSGQTLTETVEKGPLQPDDWLAFVRQSLDSVEALHGAGWVHGDLNAGNFIGGPGPVWKLLELPFLRFEPPEQRSALFGSIHTLAPEQLNGAAPDLQSDLYALGCLYYYAASGAYPNAGGRSQDIAIDRLRYAAHPLGEKAPLNAGPRADWVMNLLEREPQRRPAGIAAARQLLGG